MLEDENVMPTVEIKRHTNIVSVRNYGIDLLRIVSMMMIPVLHVLGHGGILRNAVELSASYETAWLLEVAAYCAANSYGIISGYVGYGGNHKYSKLIYLYFQAAFYSVLTTIAFLFYKPEEVGVGAIIKSFFPFAFDTYWYFSAYFCLFFFMPFLDNILDRFKKEEMQKLLILLFVVFSILPTLFYSDFGETNKGYSFLWLAVLYLLGAYIKKYGVTPSYSNWKNLLGYTLCVILTWLSRLCIEQITNSTIQKLKWGDYLIKYTSPTIVLCSVFLLFFFMNLNCGKILTKFIRIFAPVSFGVYLFHEEPLIRDTFIKNAFTGYLSLHPLVMALAVIATSLCIWLLGSSIDGIRLFVFNLFKIKKLCNFIEQKAYDLRLLLTK